VLCQRCKKKEALIHLGKGGKLTGPGTKHYCRDCADAYFARTPGRNAERGLVKLSDHDRSKLYDELEALHPEAFDNSTSEACAQASELMRRFLKKRLKKDNVTLNSDGFEMLCIDFFCSRHFYDRADSIKAKSH
jgi:hypothetical protein